MALVKPPRAAFLNFPLGRQCGPPHEVILQSQILRDTLALLSEKKEPGEIVDLPYKWHQPFNWESYLADIQDMLKEEGLTAQVWKPKQ